MATKGSGSQHYDEAFFRSIKPRSSRSARVILPVAFEWTGVPEGVIDVGCGQGAWLVECQRLGVSHVLGLDGDYVDPASLCISPSDFMAADLARPPALDRSFDLAMCLEVGEHLPRSAAGPLVRFLGSVAPAVLFSAALPGQGGTNHINEQPPGYWEELFLRHDFLMLDPIRPRVWTNPEVEAFYAQNVYLYMRSDLVRSDERLRCEFERTQAMLLTLVYKHVAWRSETIRSALGILGGALRRSVRTRLGLVKEWR